MPFRRWIRELGWRYLVALIALFLALAPVVFVIASSFNTVDTLTTARVIPESLTLENYTELFEGCSFDLGLPRPLWPLQTEAGEAPRSYLALRRKKGLFVRRTSVRNHSEILKGFVEQVCEGKISDVHLVPVTVLIGRAPDKETGLAKIFFTESWGIGGRLWQAGDEKVHVKISGQPGQRVGSMGFPNTFIDMHDKECVILQLMGKGCKSFVECILCALM